MEKNIHHKFIRHSNIELYRIILIILIIAHHYVVNSGLIEVLIESDITFSSIFFLFFGAWGKTCINCFILITSYFMCKSQFKWEKLLRLYLQVIFYTVIIYGIFCLIGYENYNPISALFIFFPIKNISSDFFSCFLLFYIFIPFLNILVKNLDKRKHLILMSLLILIYSIFPTILTINISFNYLEWFVVLYFIGSFLRIYGESLKITHLKWGLLTLLFLTLSIISIIVFFTLTKQGYEQLHPYYVIQDCNKLLALLISICSFMWIKDLKIIQSNLINLFASATFGVLLIHANSDAMRKWLWIDMTHNVDNFINNGLMAIIYAILTVIIVYIICAFIELIRIKLIDKLLLKSIYSKLFKTFSP